MPGMVRKKATRKVRAKAALPSAPAKPAPARSSKQAGKQVAPKTPTQPRSSKAGCLAPSDARLVRLSAAIVIGDWDALVALRAAAKQGEPNREWREVVLQAHLFCGFPRAVEAYAVLAEAGGLGALDPGEVRGEADQPGKGSVLFEHIYRDLTEGVREMLTAAHPDFAAWVEGHAYGRVLARPGLSAVRRELCAVAALAASGQARQLASHVRGSLRCGATASQVHGVLDAITELVSEDDLAAAKRVVARFAR